MSPAPNAPSLSLADAADRYKDATEVIFETYDKSTPSCGNHITPQQLDAGVQRFLAASLALDRGAGQLADPAEITRLGDYGISLLMDLGAWAHRLQLDDLEPEFDIVALAFADWIIRHGGEVQTIEPVVDALANFANRERDPQSLERLTHLTTRIIRSTGTRARVSIGSLYPNPQWRTLNLNNGIIATRTHNPALMEHVFDELVRNVPADAPQFFAEGMQQMEKFNFPLPVRAVMARYFDRWTRVRMN